MKLVHLITRADDAGCCSAANRAILAALGGGVLKNVSVMVPGPAFDEAAEMLAAVRGIDLGLHVTLNSEWPMTKWGPVSDAREVSALVDEGLKYLTMAIDNRPGYDAAMSYLNLTYRRKADTDCGNQAAVKDDVEKATDWSHKAMGARKENEAKKDKGPGGITVDSSGNMK